MSIMLLSLFSCGDNTTLPARTDSKEVVERSEVKKDKSETEAKVDTSNENIAVSNNLSLTGIMVTPPQNRATVSLSMSGIVRSTKLIAGGYVRKGEVIATLENPEFIALQQEYIESYAKTEQQEMEYKRQQALSLQEASTKRRLEESYADYISIKSRRDAAAVQLQLLGVTVSNVINDGIIPYLNVYAPITGYVADVDVNLGKYISMGEPICEIIDKSSVMLRLTAYEKDISHIVVGDRVTFTVNGVVDRSFDARVISVGQQIDKQNRSMEVYASILSPESLFRPGMYVRATIEQQ